MSKDETSFTSIFSTISPLPFMPRCTAHRLRQAQPPCDRTKRGAEPPRGHQPERPRSFMSSTSISHHNALHFNAPEFAAHALSSPQHLAGVLDHTLLKPSATRAEVVHLCHEAAEHKFACAMVNPTWV